MPMDKQAALALLDAELDRLRAEGYAQLVARIGHGPLVIERASGEKAYQIEIECVWDGQPGGNLRLLGAVDDGGCRAFSPLTLDFVITPDGRFLGEM